MAGGLTVLYASSSRLKANSQISQISSICQSYYKQTLPASVFANSNTTSIERHTELNWTGFGREA